MENSNPITDFFFAIFRLIYVCIAYMMIACFLAIGWNFGVDLYTDAKEDRKKKAGGPIPKKVKDAIKANIPMGEFGEVNDIAEAVAYLAGPGARYVTGQVLTVDGGMVM